MNKAIFAAQACELLVGRQIGVAEIAEAAALAQGAIDPGGSIHGSKEFQRHLAGVLTKRALTAANERARREHGMSRHPRRHRHGQRHAPIAEVEARLLLSDFLRHELCSPAPMSAASTACAAPARCCSTALAVRSCLMFAVQADGHAIMTVEGLGRSPSTCTRCRRRSATAMACNAAIARPAS